MNRKKFQLLAELRIREAGVLLKAKEFSGAYYLAGYSIECGLKACVAKQTKRHSFPVKDGSKYYIHDLERLIDLLDLRKSIKGSSVEFNWSIVKDWNEQARYERKTKAEAEAIYQAIMQPVDGVLEWLKSHW